FNLVYERIGDVIDSRNLYIALPDEQQQILRFPIYTIKGERRPPDYNRPLANGVTEYILRTQKPLLLPHAARDHIVKLGIEVRGEPAICLLGVPMFAGGQTIGVICVQDYEHPYVYNETHIELVSTIATQISAALENARLFAQTQHRAAELEEANKYLGALQ